MIAPESLGIPHPDPFVMRIRVEQDDLGVVIPHVDNARYVQWLDRAAERHADSVGLTRAALEEAGLMWFVGRHEIDYLGECWLGDELLIYTWVRDMQKVKSWREYLIYRPADEKVIMRAATLWVLVKLETRKPARIPGAWAALFGVK